MKDEKRLNQAKSQICQLPVQQFEGIRTQRSECQNEPKQMYHFNFESESCISLNFTGCFGTDNLFESEIECSDFCENLDFDSGSESDEAISEGKSFKI